MGVVLSRITLIAL
jgi:hypothetical protein